MAHWSSKLLIEKRKIESEIITQWVTQWSRQGSTQDKQAWEQFIKRFVLEVRITASTTAQTCHMEWRGTIEKPEKKQVETMVVWNGNGARARWKGESELKELVRMSDPDVLCFLEGKTDIQHLTQ